MARNTTPATQRQLDAIEVQSRRAGFAGPWEAIDAAGVTCRNWRYDLSKPDASIVLDALSGGLAPRPEPVIVPVEGGMSAVDAVAVLGETIDVEFSDKTTGEPTRRSLRVEAIKPATNDQTPALSGTAMSTLRPWSIRLSSITGWARE